jgi:DNA adenine methylase
MTKSSSEIIRPFLRWPGGKQWLATRLSKLVPKKCRTYFEPFIGGGSLFFASRPKSAKLGDLNERLIETYTAVRDRPLDVIQALSEWPNSKDIYYQIRSQVFTDNIRRAAQTIYLSKTCWNGLYRVNREGQFNVPFGNHERSVYDEKNILDASHILQTAELISCDFEDTVNSAASDDFVYIDPPYTVLHSKNGFRQYNDRLFSWNDQIRLAGVARKLIENGCSVVVSNANHPEVVKLYSGFKYYKLSRHSILAADPLRRCKTHEALFISFQGSELDNLLDKEPLNNDY